MPDANISINYVHGYRSYDTRNNVKWTKYGTVLYHTGALGIVLDPKGNTQTSFVQHTRDIVSLAIHPNGMIAATGELVAEHDFPEIYVWNINNKDILAQLKGFHTKALKFSPNGSKLLSIGEDIDHSFALYDWMSSQILTASKVGRDQVTTCEFKNDTEFVTCSVKSLKFWSVNGYNCLCTKGVMENPEPLTTAAFAFTTKTCVTGTTLGNIVAWTGRNVDKIIPAHHGKIFAMLSKSNMLITTGEDGNIITWDNTFKPLSSINLPDMIQKACVIRAIDVNNAGTYLIGTARAEIIKIEQGKPELLIEGHYKGELWALSANPNSKEFVTCGGEKLVRVWAIEVLKTEKEFMEEIKACDWAGNGSYIALGCVGGKVITVDPVNDLTVISELQSMFEKEKWISDIKVAPNNQMIAFGGAPDPSYVEVVKVGEKGENLQKMKVINIGLTGALTHLDWDATSTNLMTNSSAFELVYVNVPTWSTIKPAACADNDWHTWTCVLGFMVKGLALGFRDCIDINTVCRSSNRKVLVVGDDYARIRLYKYPCIDINATCKTYIGHSTRVTKVAFLGDEHLVSIGCKDKAVIIWNLNIDTVSETEDSSELEEQKEELEAYNEVESLALVVPQNDYIPAHEFVEGIKEPTGFFKPSATQSHLPKVDLRLKYVYGYKTKNCKNNLCYLKDGCIAYHAAALGIVHDKVANTQRFFNKHSSEIIAVAFHPDGIRIATGEHGSEPSIYIWDSTTCNQVAHFQGRLEKGVKSLAYSPSGDYLAAVDMSVYHVLAIYDANNSILLALSKTDKAAILDLAFKTENELVTVGVKHYMFWEMSNKCLKSRRGIFGDKNNVLGCVAAEKDLVLTGNKVGQIYKWDNVSIGHSESIHSKPIDCIIISEQIILTGGRDAKVCILDKKFNLLMSIEMDDPCYKSISPEIRALSLDKMGKHLLVGTIGSEIYELSIEPSSKSVEKWEPLVKGHSSPQNVAATELKGLAVFPESERFITVSEDATLRIWDLEERTQVQLINLGSTAKVVDIESLHQNIVVGFEDGSVRLIKLLTETTGFNEVEFEGPVTVIKIAPNQRMVAIASKSGIVKIYKFPSMRLASMLKHEIAVTHLDWSEDSKVIQTNTRNHKLFFWNATTGTLLINGPTVHRDEKWATWTCVYGWPVQGIIYEQKIPVTSCMRSYNVHHNYQLLAAGDVIGDLRIYRYPCLQMDAKYLVGKGHSSAVSCVRFTNGDKYLLTAGLYDGCIFQWEIS